MTTKRLPLLMLSLCLTTSGAFGEVPELVNYQGRLLDGGLPVNSNVAVSVCIYSNDTGGVSLYTEDVGNIPVVNGLYAFSFGAGGSIVASAVELVAVTDGSSLAFSTTVSNTPMLVESVSIADGVFTWDELSGSSNPSEFTVTVNHVSGLVNVFYLLGAPAIGRSIAVTYDYGVAADFSTVLANPEAWLEVKIDGVPLAPRQRLISVPYAMSAKHAESLGSVLADSPSLSEPTAGSVRWSGTAFEGFNGVTWVPLSGTLAGSIPELVTVGDAGNIDDPNSNGLGGNSGAVAYTYKIGKFEVSNAEYTEFLNAADPNGANALALYNSSMSSSSHGGIIQIVGQGIPAGSNYLVKPGFANKPVVFVSLYDAMRFCNWLHNGALVDGDTENGAYTLLGGTATPANGTFVQRNAAAKFTVPTEDEWYKAAYYEPGGDTDDYWLYPTRSNTAPTNSPPPGTAPAANYDSAVGTVTDVGAYTDTPGFYGTFDMAGNAHEWIESFDGAGRILRGGSWADAVGSLRAPISNSVGPGLDSDFLGFRISSPNE